MRFCLHPQIGEDVGERDQLKVQNTKAKKKKSCVYCNPTDPL